MQKTSGLSFTSTEVEKNRPEVGDWGGTRGPLPAQLERLAPRLVFRRRRSPDLRGGQRHRNVVGDAQRDFRIDVGELVQIGPGGHAGTFKARAMDRILGAERGQRIRFHWKNLLCCWPIGLYGSIAHLPLALRGVRYIHLYSKLNKKQLVVNTVVG